MLYEKLTSRQAIYGAAIATVHIPLCCMPKWHAHPTRHVEEFWIILATIREPSIFVLNRQDSSLDKITPVYTPNVNELFIKDTFLLHNILSFRNHNSFAAL